MFIIGDIFVKVESPFNASTARRSNIRSLSPETRTAVLV